MASNDVCGLCGAPGTALDHGTLGCAKRLRAEVAALREEVARLRDSERKAWESCRETCALLDAAERRAEEAEGRLANVRLRLEAALAPAHMASGEPDGRTVHDVVDDVVALARDLGCRFAVEG